ncbi:hypothetical protein [Edaphobacter aggregans]|uniref:hypothetical protein n=1 Tax=Edaphobacter aggregans TaxID=570835 RepID=UPI0012F9A623|nr:hypothetical protein [Edaphobacter aggregans]
MTTTRTAYSDFSLKETQSPSDVDCRSMALFALCLQASSETTLRIQIRVLNAKNGERVANQKVSVAIKGHENATEYTTDA